MDYIRIKGLGSVLLTGDKPLPEKEYLVSLRVELEGIVKDIKDPTEPQYSYLMRYVSTEGVQEIGSKKKIKVENGKTYAQKIRWALEKLAEKKGVDKDEFYESEQKQRLEKIFNEIDE